MKTLQLKGIEVVPKKDKIVEEKELEIFEKAYKAATLATKRDIEFLKKLPAEAQPNLLESGLTETELKKSWVRTLVELAIIREEKQKNQGNQL